MTSKIPTISTAAQVQEQKKCQNCGVTDKKLSQCSRCHFERYCSTECQKTAWPEHKKVCLMGLEIKKHFPSPELTFIPNKSATPSSFSIEDSPQNRQLNKAP